MGPNFYVFQSSRATSYSSTQSKTLVSILQTPKLPHIVKSNKTHLPTTRPLKLRCKLSRNQDTSERLHNQGANLDFNDSRQECRENSRFNPRKSAISISTKAAIKMQEKDRKGEQGRANQKRGRRGEGSMAENTTIATLAAKGEECSEFVVFVDGAR